MARRKKLINELLLRYGYMEREEISKKDYQSLSKSDPDAVGTYEEWFFKYKALKDIDEPGFAELIKLDNNMLFGTIESHLRIIRNILVFNLVCGIIGAAVLFILLR